MARHLRIRIRNGWYHVFHRGTQRSRIFADSKDRAHFLDLLGEVHVRYQLCIHAFALMDTHYHAIVQTPEANLSEAMQWLHLSHAAWFNTRHERLGPFWQGRFGSVPVENGAWAYQLSLYLHLNPINTEAFGLGKRAKRIEAEGLREPSAEEITRRLKALREYRWSSYRTYAGYEKGVEWLHTSDLLRRAARQKGERSRRYREDVKNVLRKGGEESTREQLRDVMAVGSETFRRKLLGIAKGGGRETSGKRALRRRVTLEEVFKAVEEAKGESRKAFLNRRGDPATPLVMWLARRYCGMKLREIGAELGGRDYAAVSDRLRRFVRDVATNATARKLQRDATRNLNLEI